MEVEQNNGEAQVLSEKEQKAIIEKAQIDERNSRAEMQSRASGFQKELAELTKHWNVTLIADVRFMGIGNNMEMVGNVAISPLPAQKETAPSSDLNVEGNG